LNIDPSIIVPAQDVVAQLAWLAAFQNRVVVGVLVVVGVASRLHVALGVGVDVLRILVVRQLVLVTRSR